MKNKQKKVIGKSKKIDSIQDISIENISLVVDNNKLLTETSLKIINSHKYGLVGHNGIGKSTFLRHLKNRYWNIDPKIDVLYVEQEVLADNKSVFDTLIETNVRRNRLLKKYDHIKKIVENNELDVSEEVIEKYDKLINKLNIYNVDRDKILCQKILSGLGFSLHEQTLPTGHFSGGWRMRIALAKALYMMPKLLLLDEPTNHLDLTAVMWLTNYLSKEWNKTLIIVSHDRNFLNNICTDIIHIENKKLIYYKGNYDAFSHNHSKNMELAKKEWAKIERKIKLMQKQSLPKNEVQKFKLANEHKKLPKPYKIKMHFSEVLEIDSGFSSLIEIRNLNFGYGDKILFSEVNMEINIGDRIVLVGKNGVGKTTLFKLILDAIENKSESIHISNKVRIGYYHQHSCDFLPLDLSPIQYIDKISPTQLSELEIRKYLGQIGLESSVHKQKISTLSGGQKSRVVFVSLYVTKPHILLLDEPTNHLDIHTIDALIDSMNKFGGAILTITHNIDLIKATCSKIYEIIDKKFIQTNFAQYESKVLNEIDE